MNATQAYILNKKYTDDTISGTGSIKGAPCTIKSITKVEGGSDVEFEWTNTSGIKETQHMIVKDGVDGLDGKDGIDGKDGATGATGPQGEKGERGDKGEKGDKGDDGAQGAQGPKGDSPTVEIGTIRTVTYDTPATASTTETATGVAINMDIPQGMPGQGDEPEEYDPEEEVVIFK